MTAVTGTITMRLPSIPVLVHRALWDRLGLGPMPFPLELPPADQNGDDLAEADRWLTYNGLGSTSQIDSAFSQALHTMATSEVGMSLLHSDPHGHTRIGCFPTQAGRALRVVLRDGMLDLGWLNARRMAEGVLEVVPAEEPADDRALGIPAALASVSRAWRSTGSLSRAVDDLVRRGAERAVAERFLLLYSTAHGIGQVSGLRYGPPVRTSAEQVTFLDTREGRYLVVHRYGTLTLLPARASVLKARMALLLTES